MRVLVCGGREFDNWVMLSSALQAATVDCPVQPTIIQGGAKGADFLARAWGKMARMAVEEYPADWKRHGRAAGAVRNQQMLDEGRPDLVVAFPGGRGTADMVQRAKRAGVPVQEIT